MTDYSQFGEQPHILKALEGYEPAMLLDVGACHPTVFSNSRALIEMGWSAVLVEPSPKPMLNMLEVYGNDPGVTLIQAAVTVDPGLLEMYITDDMVSTSSAEEHERWKGTAKYHGKMRVPTITLEDIGNRFGGMTMVSIDAEGQSASLFLEMIRLNWRPRVVVVEHDSRLTEILSVACKESYVAVHTNSTNVVLVR